MQQRRYVIIEHLEPCVSPWLLSEYRYVSQLFGDRLIFTNVRSPRDANILRGYGRIYEESFVDLVRRLPLKEAVILDPQAEAALRRSELLRADSVVIGGIMGDHPPRGRTRELITKRAPYLPARNLGKGQLTIAGTAYVIKRIEGGKELEELDLREGLSIEVSLGDIILNVELPYTFPYEDGRPVLPADYIDTVVRRSLVYEEDPCRDG